MTRNLQSVTLLLVVLFASLAFADNKKEDWLTLTPREMQMKEVPGDPGASAVQLYYADFFSKVQAGDEQQAVLKVGGSTDAQKSN